MPGSVVLPGDVVSVLGEGVSVLAGEVPSGLTVLGVVLSGEVLSVGGKPGVVPSLGLAGCGVLVPSIGVVPGVVVLSGEVVLVGDVAAGVVVLLQRELSGKR